MTVRRPGPGPGVWCAPPVEPELRSIDFEPSVDRRREHLKIIRIRADHEVVPTQSPFDHTGVDNVGRASPSGERANQACLCVIERLDLATNQQASEKRLPRTSTPCLGNDGRRRRRYVAAPQESPVTRPHPPFAAVGSD